VVECYLGKERFKGCYTEPGKAAVRRLPDFNGPAASLSGSKYHGSQTHSEMEGDMEQALLATQLLFYLLGGLGIFFLGVGVLWFVSVYKDKEK
jgi:hypothetical protein